VGVVGKTNTMTEQPNVSFTKNEVNQFLESAGFGYLTQKEKDELPSFLFAIDQKFSLCQAPNLTQHFIGRNGELHEIDQILQKDKSPIIAIYGPAGVEKVF